MSAELPPPVLAPRTPLLLPPPHEGGSSASARPRPGLVVGARPGALKVLRSSPGAPIGEQRSQRRQGRAWKGRRGACQGGTASEGDGEDAQEDREPGRARPPQLGPARPLGHPGPRERRAVAARPLRGWAPSENRPSAVSTASEPHGPYYVESSEVVNQRKGRSAPRNFCSPPAGPRRQTLSSTPPGPGDSGSWIPADAYLLARASPRPNPRLFARAGKSRDIWLNIPPQAPPLRLGAPGAASRLHVQLLWFALT